VHRNAGNAAMTSAQLRDLSAPIAPLGGEHLCEAGEREETIES